MSLASVDPSTGRLIREYPEMSANEVSGILRDAHEAFLDWRRRPLEERCASLTAAARLLKEEAPRLARMMAEEMGKPLAQGRAEAEKCAWVCDYYAANAARFLAPEEVETTAERSFVKFEPLGVVLAVMPWNFPFWQVFRFVAPALAAGNGTVLKHASNVQGCALEIQDLLHRAGVPEALFRTLVVPSGRVAEIIDDRRIKAVTLTGSTPAGRAVAARAGKALKKTVLELGGSDPYVVLEDADLPSAVESCVTSRLINNGQSCIAAKRFIVPRPILKEFEELFIARMAETVMGPPLDERTALGPQARVDLRDELHQQVQQSLALGARLLLGGVVPSGPGAYYPPTVLTEVVAGMPAYEEELFGPVAAILPVADQAEALEVANDTSFGLGAAVFTTDLERGERIASERLEAGSCFVNTFVRSDPRLPFGGIKESGYGRELSSYGLREFVNIKTVWVA